MHLDMVDLFVRVVSERMDRQALRNCGEELAVRALRGRCCGEPEPRVLRDAAGKPFAPGFDAFSIAHSGTVLVCAVARMQDGAAAAGCAAEAKRRCGVGLVGGDGERSADIDLHCGDPDAGRGFVRCDNAAADGMDKARYCGMDPRERSRTCAMAGLNQAVPGRGVVGPGSRCNRAGERWDCDAEPRMQCGAGAVENKRRCGAAENRAWWSGKPRWGGAADKIEEHDTDMDSCCGDIDVKRKVEDAVGTDVGSGAADGCHRRGAETEARCSIVEKNGALCNEMPPCGAVAEDGDRMYMESGGGAACAVRRIGVDVEKIRPRRVDRIAARFFSKREREFLTAQPDEIHRLRAFYQIWTRKEAYLKMTGRGLGERELRRVDTLELGRDVWFWHEWLDGETYTVCICLEEKDRVRLLRDGLDD